MTPPSALLFLPVLFLATAPASAQVTWDDPTLFAAVRDANLIVLATATAVAENGAAYEVRTTLKGPSRDGEVLAVTGLHHPELSERPPIVVGDLAYLILFGDPKGEGFSLPTPTFGRFVLKREQDRDFVVASLGGADTFVRFALAPARFEAIVRGLVAGRAPKIVAECRQTLADVAGVDSEQAYLALELVAELGERVDAPLALKFLRAERFNSRKTLRVRAAAVRVLGRRGGPQAARHLLERVENDPEPLVRSVAASLLPMALGPNPNPDLQRQVTTRLAQLALELPWAPIRFGAADDPRRNFVPSPLAASLLALAELGAQAGARPALLALERDRAESIAAGLDYFDRLGDRRHVGVIVQRMRPDGSPDAFINRVFARTLTKLTGEDLGDSRQAWLDWCSDRSPEEGLGPPRPRRKDGSR